jgi:hypothetical protein
VNFEVLTAVLMKVQVFWMCFFVVGVTISDVSSAYSASFFRVGKYNLKDSTRLKSVCILYSRVILVYVKLTATYSDQRNVPSSYVQLT